MTNSITRYIHSLNDIILKIPHIMEIYNINFKEFLLYYYDINNEDLIYKGIRGNSSISLKQDDKIKIIKHESYDGTRTFIFYKLNGDEYFRIFERVGFKHNWILRYKKGCVISTDGYSSYNDNRSITFKEKVDVYHYIEEELIPIIKKFLNE